MDLKDHLEELLGIRPTPFADADELLKQIELWEKTNVPSDAPVDDLHPTAVIPAEDLEVAVDSSTLAQFVQNGELSNISPSSTATKLQSKPDLQSLLPTLSGILLSDKSDDIISEEVLEILGFDEMELVFEVLQDRYNVGRQLNSSPTQQRPTSNQADQDAAMERGTGKRKGRGRHREEHDDVKLNSNAADARQRMEDALLANASRPLWTGTATAEAEVYPHVYTTTSTQLNLGSTLGSKYLLPLGTTRQDDELCEEVIIPPARPIPMKLNEHAVAIPELDELCRGCFPGYTALNRMQSIIYPTVYGTNENLLICAPTGAGKTDIAVLSVLRVLDQNRYHPSVKVANLGSTINKDDFKIIYVAPMKALAAEIVRKMGKRLAWLGIKVRELTGDMQMTRAETAETQIIVTTPEKWDVVTRKPTGEGELASRVRLLIIDEVHLLNEERGAVIETIVARTLRLVESSQSIIRIVGLSATLPNYVDVADFLQVNRHTGLFFFDQSFRPVPLEQHFIGVKGKANSQTSKKNLDRITYEKVSEMVHHGHQVMVFVHARKETVNSAQALRDIIALEGNAEDFDPREHPKFEFFRREISSSRNKEMKELFDLGFGIHHAGMLRSDRNMMERMFEARAIKVLFCTATLAWGVNLPAHAVVIKGTDVYDSGQGKFVDLSVLDVLQIFGRAGRPGMETSGVGFICTPDEKLDHYLNAVTSQHAIESKFMHGIVDSLNGEISLGTVTNVTEGVQWLAYTYLYVRLLKNPMVYGISRDEIINDPRLSERRNYLITAAARTLASCGMIRFDESRGDLSPTELGNIAAKYYIRQASIEVFNANFKPKMSEADVLGLLSRSTEFDQIQLRENEEEELKALVEKIPCEVQGGTETSKGKVNILLQGYISKAYIEDFALVSDTAYVAQNGGRIIRALLEISLSRKWANSTAVLMAMSKAVEKRMWPYDHPLSQFSLHKDLLYNLQQWADELSVNELSSQTAAELGRLIHLNEKHGEALLRSAKEFPAARIGYSLRPITADLLKISVKITPTFTWSNKVHGSVEPFWLWVENEEGVDIIQYFRSVFRSNTKLIETEFVIPMHHPLPSSITLRFVSDKWLGAEEEIVVPLSGLKMPPTPLNHTPLLALPFLGFQALRNSTLAARYSWFHSMNGMQTQCFFTTYNTLHNVLISAPAASGKKTLAQMGIWHSIFNATAPTSALVVSSRKNHARAFASSIRHLVGSDADLALAFSDGDLMKISNRATIKITSASVLLSAMSKPKSRDLLDSLSVVVVDHLEELDDTYELALSLLLHATQARPVRIIGSTVSLNNPNDIAAWLHVQTNNGLYSFPPSTREQAIITTTHTTTIPHSAAFFKTTIKPVYAAVRSITSTSSVIIFVPARPLCKTVMADLMTQCAVEMQTRGFLPNDISDDRIEYLLARLKDHSLDEPLRRSIGVYHDGLSQSDRNLMLELYLEGVLRVMVMPREQCWSTSLRAGLIVAMGTQYLQVQSDDGSDRKLVNYSNHEVIRMQSLAVRQGQVGRFMVVCQTEEKDTLMRFLNQGLPLESSLAQSEVLRKWIAERIEDGSVRTKQDVVDFLSFTYLARRLRSNPTYYDAEPDQPDEALSRLTDRVWPLAPPAPASSEKLVPSSSQ